MTDQSTLWKYGQNWSVYGSLVTVSSLVNRARGVHDNVGIYPGIGIFGNSENINRVPNIPLQTIFQRQQSSADDEILPTTSFTIRNTFKHFIIKLYTMQIRLNDPPKYNELYIQFYLSIRKIVKRFVRENDWKRPNPDMCQFWGISGGTSQCAFWNTDYSGEFLTAEGLLPQAKLTWNN